MVDAQGKCIHTHDLLAFGTDSASTSRYTILTHMTHLERETSTHKGDNYANAAIHRPTFSCSSTYRSGLSSVATVMNLVIAHDEPSENGSPFLGRYDLAHCAP